MPSSPAKEVVGTEPANLLNIQALTKRFSVGPRRRADSTVRAVTDMQFGIVAGGALALVGESGCGKTTTARMIVGLETPSSGEIAWKNQPLPTPKSASQRRSRAKLMQMVFQNPYASLSPAQSVRATLSEVVTLHTSRRRTDVDNRVDELALQVGLSGVELSRRPRKLSGGQCQRAAIARALAAEPELVVLDEAVSALDVSTQAQILNLIDQLRRSLGIAILLITHDLAVVRQVCEDVIVMESGVTVESGRVHEVLSEPREAYTKRLVDAVPRGPEAAR